MTSTVVRDSIVGDAWIAATAQQVPVQAVIDADSGQPTGSYLTGPVRLAFDTLFTLPKATPDNENPKFGAILLFTPHADFGPLYEAYYKVCATSFAGNYDAPSQQYLGLHSPFRDQGEKAKFGGFTPGIPFVSVSTQFKPPVVDARGNPIVDPSKVYPGIWAICSIHAYAFNTAKKKGVSFGLDSVMIIGDDTKLGGGAVDPNKTFASAMGAISPPATAGAALGNMPVGAPPSMPPTGGAPSAPPSMPPSAPSGAAYTMPGSPPADPRGPVPQGYGSWAEYDADMADL